MASQTRLVPVSFAPGLHRNTTEYGAENNWYSADKVRFRSGQAETIGGYQRQKEDSFLGTARSVAQWSLLDGRKTMAVGTNSHLYNWYGGLFYDITPVVASSTNTDIINTVAGEVTVLVSAVNHGATAGASYIYFVSAPPVGNVNLNGREFLVNSVIDANTLTIVNTTVANTTGSDGASTKWQITVPAGKASADISFGYGRGAYGSGAYGVPGGTSGIEIPIRMWSLNPWGEDLLANPRGGGLYIWDASGDFVDRLNRAVIVTAAPSIIDYSFVSDPTRHVVALGTTDWSTGIYDPLLVRWCTDSNYNDWIPTGLNTAGDYRLNGGSRILGYSQAKTDTLIWTDSELHKMSYAGAPLYFTFDKLGANTGLMGPNAVVEMGNTLYWMGYNGFFKYDGTIQQLQCPFSQDVFDTGAPYRIDYSQRDKVFCGVNTAFAEIIWLYQTEDSATGENNRYICYNYNENTWYDGYLNRTTWSDAGMFSTVLAAGDDNYLYAHELGHNPDNDPMATYLESATFDIENGDSVLIVSRLIPDFQGDGEIKLKLFTKKFPGTGSWTETGPYTIDVETGKVDVRNARGRQAKIRIYTDESDAYWQLGKMRMSIKDNGKQ